MKKNFLLPLLLAAVLLATIALAIYHPTPFPFAPDIVPTADTTQLPRDRKTPGAPPIEDKKGSGGTISAQDR